MFELWGLTLGELSALVAIATALLLWVKKIRVFLVKVWKKSFGRRAEQLNRIELELVSNHGSSIKDAIRRIEQRQLGVDAFLRTSLNLHDVAIVRTDAEGKLYYINREYQRLTGASISEVRGDGWVNVIHPDNRDVIVKKWNDSVKSKREFHEDIRFITVNGEPFWAHANVYRELDDNNQIRGYLGVIVPFIEDKRCPYRDTCEAHKELGLLNERVKN